LSGVAGEACVAAALALAVAGVEAVAAVPQPARNAIKMTVTSTTPPVLDHDFFIKCLLKCGNIALNVPAGFLVAVYFRLIFGKDGPPLAQRAALYPIPCEKRRRMDFTCMPVLLCKLAKYAGIDFHATKTLKLITAFFGQFSTTQGSN
jgi:hypothetical protein